MRITLDVKAGPHKGRSFMFSGHDTFLVGRSKQAHFRLRTKDKYFSRMHFLVEVNAPRCRLMDMGSRNGTYVNGKKVLRADLAHGDRIRAGHTLLLVSLEPSDLLPPEMSSVSLQPRKEPPPPSAASALATTWDLMLLPSARPLLTPDGDICLACPALVDGPSRLLCTRCNALADTIEQSVAGYRIVREIGRGSMGIVYLAIRLAESARVALKMINPVAEVLETDVQRFLRETRIHSGLDHPNIVRFHEMGGDAGRLFFVMDYIPGVDAGRFVRDEHPLTVARAVGLGCQLLDALAYAHSKGFVHRDVKPTNLVITEEEGREVLKLADFGLARAYHTSQLSGLTVTGDVGGTIPFMAPEQITHFREAKPPADQYAAAASLYYLLTGQFLFDFPETNEQKLRAVLQGAPIPIQTRREDVPTALAAVIHRALHRSAAKRFPDVAAFREALLPFSGQTRPPTSYQVNDSGGG